MCHHSVFYNLLFVLIVFFFFKQKTANELRISDLSSDVCSSDLNHAGYTIGTCVMSPPLRTAATRLSQIGQAGSGTREPAATSVSEISRCPAVAPRYCATIDPTDVPTR